MLDPRDAIVLADGVRLDGDTVCDVVRSGRFPANATARFVLSRAGRPLGEIVDELAVAHGIERGRARDDVLAFAFSLNRHLLVNVRPGRGRLVRALGAIEAALRLVPTGTAPRIAWQRVALDTRGAVRAVATTIRAVTRRALVLSVAAALLVAQTAALAGATGLTAALVVGSAVGLGLALHEAGHAAALGGVPAALVLAGPRTFVLHAALAGRRRRLVAAAGPATPLIAAAVVATAARPLESVALALAACALGGHGIGLTVATSDGRVACTE